MNLEAIMLRRRDEMLARRSTWCRRDPDEPRKEERLCVVCGARPPAIAPGARRSHKKNRTPRNVQICVECREAGWTAAQCQCGAPLTLNDRRAYGRMKGRCRACRRQACEDLLGENFAQANFRSRP